MAIVLAAQEALVLAVQRARSVCWRVVLLCICVVPLPALRCYCSAPTALSPSHFLYQQLTQPHV